MSFYLGLLLKNKVIIAADRRVFNPATNTQEDSFDKIGKISEFVYFSGAGNMPFGMKLFKLIKDNAIEFIDDVQKVSVDDMKRIYDEEMTRASKEIIGFDNLKGTEGYSNVSVMLGGFDKQRKPTLCCTSNFEKFKYSFTSNYLSVIHPNMQPAIIQTIENNLTMTRQQIKDLNEDEQILVISKHIPSLFRDISAQDSSVSAICDMLILDSNGNSKRDSFNKMSRNSKLGWIKNLFKKP